MQKIHAQLYQSQVRLIRLFKNIYTFLQIKHKNKRSIDIII